jgi:amino-acid N-acetyltransferase
MTHIDIRPARPGDFGAVTSLLRGAGLPVEDLAGERMTDFLVASTGASLAGVIGLEAFPQLGLLRSLVVDPNSRAAGVGRLLVAALEAHARRRGLTELWLLTIDADRYFQALGYVAAERDAAPQAIRETAEFSQLCPGTAILMRKTL